MYSIIIVQWHDVLLPVINHCTIRWNIKTTLWN